MMHPLRTGLLLALSLCLILSGFAPGVFAAETNSPIDWVHAQDLLRRSQQGEQLSPEDQAYLDRAKAERAQMHGNFPGVASPADAERARQIMAKQSSGQQLTEEETAFLQKMRARFGRAGKPLPRVLQVPPPRDTTGLVPLDQMKAEDRYKGQDGGLYGGGRNQPPAAHRSAAVAESKRIVPLDADGKPSEKGRVVLLSIGMSNTTMEYSKFKELADGDPAKSASLVIVDGAQGGQDAEKWNRPEAQPWHVAEDGLGAAGVTTNQVQAVWLKQALIAPGRLGEFPKASEALEAQTLGSLHRRQNRSFPSSAPRRSPWKPRLA